MKKGKSLFLSSAQPPLLEWEQQVYPVVLEAAAAHDDAPSFEAWQHGRAWLRASIDRLLAEAEARVARGPQAESALLSVQTGEWAATLGRSERRVARRFGRS